MRGPAGFRDTVAEALRHGVADGIDLHVGDQGDLRIRPQRRAQLLDAAVGVALRDEQLAGGGDLGADPVGVVPGVVDRRQGDAAFGPRLADGVKRL